MREHVISLLCLIFECRCAFDVGPCKPQASNAGSLSSVSKPKLKPRVKSSAHPCCQLAHSVLSALRGQTAMHESAQCANSSVPMQTHICTVQKLISDVPEIPNQSSKKFESSRLCGDQVNSCTAGELPLGQHPLPDSDNTSRTRRERDFPV